MDIFTKAELGALVRREKPQSVSIYLPAHREVEQSRRAHLRLQGLLKQAEEQLLAHLRPQQATALLSPARRLLEDDTIWHQRSGGLALFLAQGFCQHYWLPASFEEAVTVSEVFLITPLVRFLTMECPFFLLVLTQNSVGLYQGTRDSLDPVELPGKLAESLKSEFEGTEFNADTRRHTVGLSAKSGKGSSVSHGPDLKSAEKRLLDQYVRTVALGMSDFLRGRHLPLLLAAVGNYHSSFNEACSYAGFLLDGIKGSYEKVGTRALLARARPQVEAWYQHRVENALDQCRQMSGTRRVSDNLHRIIPAAYHGDVERLFVSSELEVWGHYDPEGGRVNVHQTRQPRDLELVNCALRQTILHDGEVFVVPEHDVPAGAAGSPVVATFRG